MADISQSLSLPYIAPSQAQKHVTHNEALRILDVLTQLAVASDDEVTPPAASEGARYIIGNGATGDWLGHDGEIALFETGTWRFFVPRAGWRAFVLNRETLAVYDGQDWIDLDSDELQEIVQFGFGMIAPQETPFSAKLNRALWTALYAADGGDGAFVSTLNKEAGSDDLGFVLQQDFQTRALFGLFGSNDLRIATSADGANFRDGLVFDNASGAVSQPNLPRFKGTTNFDNYVPADTWTKIAINVAEFNDQGSFDAATNVFTAPADGTYVFGASLTFKENGSDLARMSVRLLVNGGTEMSGSRAAITGAHVTERTTLGLQAMTLLNAGDTVEIEGRMNDFDGYFMADRTCFWGYKVG